MNRAGILIVVLCIAVLCGAAPSFSAWVETQGGRVFIVDRTGEQWDVTEAKKLGFIPQWFQYGVGKNAFTPLGDEDLGEGGLSGVSGKRVIGVEVEGGAHAYSVRKLSRHEIANTTIAGKPIAAGY